VSFFERLLVDIAKTSVKGIAKKTLSEKTYKRTSIVLTVISSVLAIVMIGYFIFFYLFLKIIKGVDTF